MLELQEIRTEGDQADRPRNVPRVNVEVDVAAPGCVVERHYVKRGKALIEVYADRLRALADRVRIAAHRQALAQATAQADTLNAEWRRKNATAIKRMRKERGDAETEQWIEREAPHRPEQYLGHFGFRTGIPPIASMTIVSQDRTQRLECTDTETHTTGVGDEASAVERLSLAEWETLSDDDKQAFLRVAPRTAGNESDRLAQAIASAISNAQQSGGRRKSG